jgi:hypothetical protein
VLALKWLVGKNADATRLLNTEKNAADFLSPTRSIETFLHVLTDLI